MAKDKRQVIQHMQRTTTDNGQISKIKRSPAVFVSALEAALAKKSNLDL
jgi:hypothetical protein